MKLKMEFEYSDNTSCFEPKIFFKSLYKIFCTLYKYVQDIQNGYAFMKVFAKTCWGENSVFPRYANIRLESHDVLES